MRPVRIRVEGFAAYRKAVEVDFEDVEFFSLTGPTGSGKSSLIDAMVFALYGRVPRLGGNTLAPAISAGGDRARVAFDFAVGDDVYTAVRMAQRTSTGGASVREARLQKGDRVIADGADDVTAGVEQLLRLRFEDFTRTVVLPQGDFARFLTATKSERQGLLRNLLGFDVYTRVRELARTRAAVAQERIESTQRAIDTLDLGSPDELDDARHRVEALTALGGEIADDQAALDEARAQLDQASSLAAKLEDQAIRLEAITLPERLGEIEALIGEAKDDVVDAMTALEAADVAVNELTAALEDRPSVSQVEMWARQREELSALSEQIEASMPAAATEALAAAESDLEAANTVSEEAASALAGARQMHSAHVLTASLQVGEACPVCQVLVDEVPEASPVPEIPALEEAERSAGAALDEARAKVVEAKTALAAIQSRLADLSERRDALAVELETVPSIDELAEMQETNERLIADLQQARTNKEEAQRAKQTAEKSLEDLADDSRQLTRRFNTAQLSVADLDPPVPEADDVIVQWKELVAWRDAVLDSVRNQQKDASASVEERATKIEKMRSALVSRLTELEIEATEPFGVQVAAALEAARARVASHERAAADAERLSGEQKKAETDRAVAETLAGHLKANGFEQWLMAGALHELVAGANQLLDQLSGGGYSLQSDDSGAFSIVDHRNADESRPVATLSGGETFLVSMALALSLAETLAAKGGSGLDAIILDEGFGTLDDETLDTVAAVLEELAGTGLMVGVITHVKDLAARAPVRYEVTRQPDGARVALKEPT